MNPEFIATIWPLRRCAVFIAAILLSSATAALSHDYVPGAVQQKPILIQGGNLFTVSGPMQAQTDILFENGRISLIGKNLPVPADAEVIDATGQNVYPGLIAAYTAVGLSEVTAVRATNDVVEIGSVTPEVSTHIAYNPDSELLPSIRANGITTVQVAPGGSLIRGRSSIMNLDGWTREDAAVKINDGLHLTWPSSRINTAWWESRTPEEQKKQMAEARDRLRELFDDARAYMLAKETDATNDIDLRWEAMIPVLKRKIPLFVKANDVRQIEEAVAFGEEQKVRIILVSAGEVWKVTELLRDKNIPVILGPIFGPPMRRADGYDTPNRTPSILRKAGVKFCIAQGDRRGWPASWTAKNLPFQAGTAVGYGLSPDQALRAITLSVAEILGIDNEVGSLDVGKRATIIISDGDVMDHITHNVTHMWIDGRKVDLDNRQKEFYRKYQQKSYSR